MKQIKKIYQDTYQITEKGCAGSVSMFLLVGTKKALLIDCGYGSLDLPGIIKQITDKEVILINTHGHIDHANGTHMFKNAYLHSTDHDLYQQHSSYQFIKEANLLVTKKIMEKGGPKAEEKIKEIEALASHPQASLKAVEELEKIDLGDRNISWVHTPGHTPGSICLLDETYHIMFSGDSLGMMVWLSLPESSTVTKYRDMLNELKKVSDTKGILKHYPAHMPKAIKINAIDKHIKCADTILSGKKRPRYMEMIFTKGNMIFSHGCAILYKEV